MTILFIYFYIRALFCLHELTVSFLEKLNTSAFFGTVILCIYLSALLVSQALT